MQRAMRRKTWLPVGIAGGTTLKQDFSQAFCIFIEESEVKSRKYLLNASCSYSTGTTIITVPTDNHVCY